MPEATQLPGAVVEYSALWDRLLARLQTWDCSGGLELTRGLVSFVSERLELLVDFQHCEKGFLGNLNPPNFLHPLLAFLLFFQKFALTGDVAAVTLCNHIFAHCFHGLTCDHLIADRGLNRHLKHLTRNQLLHFLGEGASLRLSGAAVQHERKRIDRLVRDKNIQFYEI